MPKKLSDENKQEILKLYRESAETTSTLADRYQVSSSTISRFLKTNLSTSEYEELIQQKRMNRTPNRIESEFEEECQPELIAATSAVSPSNIPSLFTLEEEKTTLEEEIIPTPKFCPLSRNKALMDTNISSEQQILALLQLASPALPVGAYSYSEGLETLIERGVIVDRPSLQSWIEFELRWGAIPIEATMMLQADRQFQQRDKVGLTESNKWLSATRETKELREQSWQMGRSLLKLLVDLQPELTWVKEAIIGDCNYAVAFGIAAASWQIDSFIAVLGYLQNWAANLISAAVKLIPLGQTVGQQLLFNLNTSLLTAKEAIQLLEDRDLNSCS